MSGFSVCDSSGPRSISSGARAGVNAAPIGAANRPGEPSWSSKDKGKLDTGQSQLGSSEWLAAVLYQVLYMGYSHVSIARIESCRWP